LSLFGFLDFATLLLSKCIWIQISFKSETVNFYLDFWQSQFTF
jgi:hypothetical protein